MPLIEMPFVQVALNIVGLLLNSSVGYQYILVIIDYAIHFPEAVPLRFIMAAQLAEELLKWIARVGFSL